MAGAGLPIPTRLSGCDNLAGEQRALAPRSEEPAMELAPSATILAYRHGASRFFRAACARQAGVGGDLTPVFDGFNPWCFKCGAYIVPPSNPDVCALCQMEFWQLIVTVGGLTFCSRQCATRAETIEPGQIPAPPSEV